MTTRNHNGKNRFGGGPKLPPDDYDWFAKEFERIARKEKRSKPLSANEFLQRVHLANFDASLDGVRDYQEYHRSRKKVGGIGAS